MIVRPASLADGDSVADIRVASWRSTYVEIVPASYLATMDPNREHWRAVASEQILNVKLLVCDADGAVQGFACYGPAREPAYSCDAELYATYFLPASQGRGYGGATMRAALADLARDGYNDAILWVMEENKRARQFYEKIGGAEVHGSRRSFEIDAQEIWEVAYGFVLSRA